MGGVRCRLTKVFRLRENTLVILVMYLVHKSSVGKIWQGQDS
jgi:hypothetical protein